MSNDKIVAQLLDKFYRGETSREEELLLRQELNSRSSSNQWEGDRQLLNLLQMEAVEVPGDLEQQMGRFINSMEKSETSSKRKRFQYVLPKISSLKTVAIAASLLLVASIALYSIFSKDKSTPVPVDTYDNPEDAHRATFKPYSSLLPTLKRHRYRGAGRSTH